MRYEIDEQKMKIEGAEEICKIGINWAEIHLNKEVDILKANKQMLAGTLDKLDENYKSNLKILGQESYQGKIICIENYLGQPIKEKYEKILNKLIESKINEVKNYQPIK